MSVIQDVFEIKDRMEASLNEPDIDLSFEGRNGELLIQEEVDSGITIGFIGGSSGGEFNGTKTIKKKVNLVASNIGGSQASRCKVQIQIISDSEVERYRLGWLPKNKRGEIEHVFDPVELDPSDWRTIELFSFEVNTNLDGEERTDSYCMIPSSSEEHTKLEPGEEYTVQIQVTSQEGFSDTLEFDIEWDSEVREESIKSAISTSEEQL